MGDTVEQETRDEKVESCHADNVADQNPTFLPINVTQTLTETLNFAKNWGSKVYHTVSTAVTEEMNSSKLTENFNLDELTKNVKDAMENVPIIRNFQHTQSEFVAQQLSKNLTTIVVGDQSQSYLPWDPEVSGYSQPNQIEQLRTRILSLSQQPNTFLLPPPAEAEINEATTRWTPASVELAKTMLQVDENLRNMRLKLVPSKINDDVFWRNYFYRLSTVRESFQLLAMSGTNSPAEEEEEDSNDFVRLEDDQPDETTVKEEKKKSRKTTKTSQQRKKPTDKSKSSSPPADDDSEQQSQCKPPAALTPEELIEAELDRELDEMVLVSPADADEIDRQLELELLAEMGEKPSAD